MSTPKRRWLRFSLRGLLLAVTLLTIWLGWNVHVVRQRKAILSSIDIRVWRANQPLEMPLVRRLLGDQAILGIHLPAGSSAADLETAAALFPEAEVTGPLRPPLVKHRPLIAEPETEGRTVNPHLL